MQAHMKNLALKFFILIIFLKKLIGRRVLLFAFTTKRSMKLRWSCAIFFRNLQLQAVYNYRIRKNRLKTYTTH